MHEDCYGFCFVSCVLRALTDFLAAFRLDFGRFSHASQRSVSKLLGGLSVLLTVSYFLHSVSSTAVIIESVFQDFLVCICINVWTHRPIINQRCPNIVPGTNTEGGDVRNSLKYQHGGYFHEAWFLFRLVLQISNGSLFLCHIMLWYCLKICCSIKYVYQAQYLKSFLSNVS